MFTTTISATSMCRTSGVIAPIVWLHITIVVVMLLFSIIVSYLFIYLSFVCVGIVYDRAGTRITAVSIILLGGENISFNASLVMHVNSALGVLFQMYLELEVMEDNHRW
jgi:hypothetical protein